MKQQYLSDEQLNALIAEVEEQELVPAPGDILSGVLRKMEEKQQDPPELKAAGSKEQKRIRELPDKKGLEFRRYCLRVVTSAAAAIALVFLLPALNNVQREEQIAKQLLVPPKIESQKEYKDKKKESLTEKIGNCRVIRDGELLTIIKSLGGK